MGSFLFGHDVVGEGDEDVFEGGLDGAESELGEG